MMIVLSMSRHCLSVFILFVWIILARLSTLVLIFLTICVVGLLQDSRPSDLVTEIGCLNSMVFCRSYVLSSVFNHLDLWYILV